MNRLEVEVLEVGELRQMLDHLIHEEGIALGSTHGRLSFPKIYRMYRKMQLAIYFSDIRVVNGVIMDGHHRYLASILAGRNLDQAPGVRTSAKVDFDWKQVVFEDYDWDKPHQVKMHNIQDARDLEMSLDEFLEKIR